MLVTMPPSRPARLRALLLAVGLWLTGCAADPPTVSPSGVDMLEIPTPSPDPGDFVETIDNPWLPLLPGAEGVYETPGDGTVTVTVTDRTRDVAGVTTTVVTDVVTDEDGEVVEETEEWFAQDRAGNVWSFGEDVVEQHGRGRADTGGSWEAGVDGAEAGIAMLARPRRGDGYQQELAPGRAEDRATIVSLDESRDVGAGSYDGLLLIEVSTPLEPGLVEHEYYARGTGLVVEETVSGSGDGAELVGFTPGEAAR